SRPARASFQTLLPHEGPTMNRYPLTSQLGAAALALAAACLSLPSAASAQDPPLPTKGDEEPPLPTKKKLVKLVMLQVTAPAAEVRAGAELIARLRIKQVLPFLKKKAGYYLVSVNGKKGWLAESDVRLIEVPVEVDAGAEPPEKA